MFVNILQNSQENTCARVCFLIKLYEKTLTRMFSCKFYEIFKKIFFTEHRRVTASVQCYNTDGTCKVVSICCNVLQKLLLILTGLLWKSVRYNSIGPSAKFQTGKLVFIFYESLPFFWIQYNVSFKCSKIYVRN